MATATKVNPKSLDKATEIIEASKRDAAAFYEAWEEAIRTAAEADDYAPPPNIMALGRLCGIEVDDRFELQKEVSRIRRASRWKEIAGSDAEFSKAQQALAQAAADEEQRGPELRKQIEEAEQNLKALRDARLSAEIPVQAMRDAREQLRKPSVLPPHVVGGYHHSIRFAKADLSSRVATLEHEIEAIDGVLSLSPSSVEALDYVNARELRHLKSPSEYGSVKNRVDVTAWGTHCDELRKERERIAKELGPKRQQLDKSLKECESQLDYYVNQIA